MLLFHLHSSAQPTYFIFDKASPVFILIFILHKYGHLGDGEGRELSWSVFEKLLYPQTKPQFCLKLNGRENLYFKSKTRNRGCVCKEHVKRTPCCDDFALWKIFTLQGKGFGAFGCLPYCLNCLVALTSNDLFSTTADSYLFLRR